MTARWHMERADCRAALNAIGGGGHVVITDPVWPNAPAGMFAVTDPVTLFADAAALVPRFARRLVVVLGVMSDPRMLAVVPASLPFVRACWLRHAVPSYCGTVLASADIAYAFGDHRAPHGKTVIPGETQQNSPTRLASEAGEHPCPRRLAHMLWLVRWFTEPDDLVIDPFAGSGTTGVAALRLGRRFWGCELEPRWHALAEERLRAEVSGQSLQESRSGQIALFGGAP